MTLNTKINFVSGLWKTKINRLLYWNDKNNSCNNINDVCKLEDQPAFSSTLQNGIVLFARQIYTDQTTQLLYYPLYQNQHLTQFL